MTSWIRRVAVLLPSRAWQRVVAALCLLGGLPCGLSSIPFVLAQVVASCNLGCV
jgi:hypothetical protein